MINNERILKFEYILVVFLYPEFRIPYLYYNEYDIHFIINV